MIMKLPLVSVIIPTLNEENYIENTLKVIRNQDYKGKYEIILADAMSTDKTVQIARKYCDKIVVVKKRGISLGRNAGANSADGEILVFVDSDTILLPNTIQELIKPFRRKNVVATICTLLPLSNKKLYHILSPIGNVFIRMSIRLKKAHLPGICFACRVDSFMKVNGFDNSKKNIEDFDFSMRLNKLGEICFTDKTKVFTSMRRFEKWGVMKAVKEYSNAYFPFIINKKRVNSQKFQPVR